MSYEESAKRLHKAMKGFGTDESAIIKEVCSNSCAERQEIKKVYLSLYGHTLENDIKSEISGHFLDGVLALLMPIDEYEAHCMRNAMKGLGTNEKVLIELLCTKDPNEIKHLSATYKKLFNRDMLEDVQSEQGGDLGRVLTSLASGNRDNSYAVDKKLAAQDAVALYEAGEAKLGTDEIEFIRILCSRNFYQLRETFEAYYATTSKDIEKSIKSETSGKFGRALLAIVKSIRNRPGYFAELLQEAMKGLGTNNKDLIRILVCRAERDLPSIKSEYKRVYHKSLYDAVKSELSGDYQKLFLTLIGKD